MKKSLYVLSVLLILVLVLASCSDTRSTAGEHKVTLLISEGITVNGDNPATVVDGADASFSLTLADGYAFRGASGGVYDVLNDTLTVNNVTEDMRINLLAEKVDYSTKVKYSFDFCGTGKDECSIPDSSSVRAGTQISVKAGDLSRVFVGWSAGKSVAAGGNIISSERDYTFALSPDVVTDGELILYSNYTDSNSLYYNLNGGEVDRGSHNLAQNPYYTAEITADAVKVTLNADTFEKMGAASLFYDDGSFSREGYILKEYNTKSDGSGTGYSLGSKFPMNTDERVLYCIWSKASDESLFKYVPVSIKCPVSEDRAPHWVEDGVAIIEYLGDESTVTIPEMIDGKYVISIASDAIKNANMKTLVMGRRILQLHDGAISDSPALETIYYPDGIYYVSNDALDTESYKSLKNFYVNATIAPRYSTGDGSFALKLGRFMSADKPRIVIIGGSSVFQGLSSEYLEALLGNKYSIINFGTTRTTHGYMYLEAMGALANSDDIILYAPENSIYMMGEPRLYWKSLRDMEGMYNIFRHIDISGYENVLGAFSELNVGDPDEPDPNGSPRYQRKVGRYEDAVTRSSMNERGEYQHKDRASLCNESLYKDVYVVTLNNRFKSRLEGNWQNLDPNEDYNSPSSIGWCNLTDARYKDNMNRAISSAKRSGALVMFSFCPVDRDKLADGVLSSDTWLSDYEALIKNNYVFDGLLGSVESYIFEHKYFYDNAFHPNDFGRTYRTYAVYRDLAAVLGLGEAVDIKSVGVQFEGCLFE